MLARPDRRIVRGAPPHRRLLVLLILAGVMAACSAADDGVRVRDRDGAGVVFEDQA